MTQFVHESWKSVPDDAVESIRKEAYTLCADDNVTDEEKAYLFSDTSIRRYYVAREGKRTKIIKALRKTLLWRREFLPHELHAFDEDIALHGKTGKNYPLGHDVEGRPVVVMRIRLDQPCDDEGRRQKLKLMIFQLERCLQRHEQVVWLIDCKGFGWKHIDMRITSMLGKIVNKHYPERLGAMLLINAPTIFRVFWKMAQVFLKPRTAKKIEFIHGNAEKQRKMLTAYIRPQQLEEDYGGDLRFVFEYDVHWEHPVFDPESDPRMASAQCSA